MSATDTQLAVISWRFRPGCAREVRELLLQYPRPESAQIRDEAGTVVGSMVRTAVFVRDNQVVRIMEFTGPLHALLKQKSTENRDFSVDIALQEIPGYLEHPVDLTTPDGFRQFLWGVRHGDALRPQRR
ncbi:SchA/CurD-like domain-containing protein [Fodinicola feengrottensis]|uniref:SchA/CurD-like domain-containing protein n=1 Tax=Fodinicola feengrottensis TaxID=435914 RepID=UPI0013D2E627|nr:SchA/CurD-like domain-containing protein [Fodinicola feengrottensis]